MILDGAIDPHADPVQAEIDQDAAFQKAFDDYAADCASSGTARWAPTRPRPSTSTGTWWTRWSAKPAATRTRAG